MKSTFLLAILLLCANVHAQNFSLLKDINTSRDANPHNDIMDMYLEDSLYHAFPEFSGLRNFRLSKRETLPQIKEKKERFGQHMLIR